MFSREEVIGQNNSLGDKTALSKTNLRNDRKSPDLPKGNNKRVQPTTINKHGHSQIIKHGHNLR